MFPIQIITAFNYKKKLDIHNDYPSPIIAIIHITVKCDIPTY